MYVYILYTHTHTHTPQKRANSVFRARAHPRKRTSSAHPQTYRASSCRLIRWQTEIHHHHHPSRCHARQPEPDLTEGLGNQGPQSPGTRPAPECDEHSRCLPPALPSATAACWYVSVCARACVCACVHSCCRRPPHPSAIAD